MNDYKAVIEETVQTTVYEMKKHKLLKQKKQTPFEKTEALLYNYMNFKEAIKDKYLQIEVIKEEGIPKKSTSITKITGVTTYDTRSEFERSQDMVSAIESSIRVTKRFINMIESALKTLEKDPYYEIIKLKYFDGETREEIADYYGVDVSTISRNKNRLINLLQIRLFSDEVIYDILSM